MTHQIHLLLGGPITIPQISLPTEGPGTAPLTHPNLEGLLTPWIPRNPEGPIVTPQVWLLMALIHCPGPKAVKPQREPLAKLPHSGRGQDPPICHSQRTANMRMIRISLLHEKSKQNPILEISSMILEALLPAVGNSIQALHLGDIRVTCWTLLPTQVTVGKPLIQIFLLHGINKV